MWVEVLIAAIKYRLWGRIQPSAAQRHQVQNMKVDGRVIRSQTPISESAGTTQLSVSPAQTVTTTAFKAERLSQPLSNPDSS